MKLSLEYLNHRHTFWKNRIGEVGIWDPDLFKPVSIVIRPDCKSYNALFIRRYLKKDGQRRLVDRIFIYNKTEEFDPKFLDSLLVHEMIHQYIVQNNLKDKTTHGPIFRSFMHRINEEFAGELSINISDINPAYILKGPGTKIHTILLIHFQTGFSYCCVINPTKKDFFESLVKKNPYKWKIKSYQWAQSVNMEFNRYSRCTKTLHGIKKTFDEMQRFCQKYNIHIIR